MNDLFMRCSFGCAGSLDSVLGCDIFTLTDKSFHYSSEKNKQDHVRGKKITNQGE